MRRDQVGNIVAIGNGLCRVIVRSERLAKRLAAIPDVRVIDETSDNLGWWLVFPEQMRPMFERLFREQIKTIHAGGPRDKQMPLFDDVPDEAIEEGAPPGKGTERGEDPPGG